MLIHRSEIIPFRQALISPFCVHLLCLRPIYAIAQCVDAETGEDRGFAWECAYHSHETWKRGQPADLVAKRGEA
jgi:hypothetical protein